MGKKKEKRKRERHQRSNPVEAFIKKWKLISCQSLLPLTLGSHNGLHLLHDDFLQLFVCSFVCLFVCLFVRLFVRWPCAMPFRFYCCSIFYLAFINFLLSAVGRDTMK